VQDGRAQVSGVEVEAACKVERIFLAAARGAEDIARLKNALTGEKKTTSGAKGAPTGSKAVPASPANAGPGEPIELVGAQGAVRWKESGKQTVDKL
jgi:hypothetical protein